MIKILSFIWTVFVNTNIVHISRVFNKRLHFDVCSDLQMDLLRIGIFYKYLVDGLLDLIMALIFVIQSRQLLIFCKVIKNFRPI